MFPEVSNLSKRFKILTSKHSRLNQEQPLMFYKMKIIPTPQMTQTKLIWANYVLTWDNILVKILAHTKIITINLNK